MARQHRMSTASRHGTASGTYDNSIDLVTWDWGSPPPGAANSRNSPLQVQRLQKLGLSAVGARQLLDGQMVTNPDDRSQLADLFAQTLVRSGQQIKDGTSNTIVFAERYARD